MKSVKFILIFLIILSVFLPICFADEINTQTDANGNLINDGEFIREYNGLNQLVRIKNTTDGKLMQEFIYHPTEERVYIKKEYNTDGSLKEKTIYINKNSVRVINSSGTFDSTFVYHNGQMVSQEVNGEKLYIHGDHLGSSSVVTNSSGDVIERTEFEPFGSIVSGGESTRYGYTGQEFDSVLGDYDYNARRYNSNYGIFLTPDSTIQAIYDSQNLNRYSYVLNNPYRYTDPNGLWAVQIGGSVSGGLGALAPVGGTGGGGFALSYDEEQGLEFGLYGNGGGGALFGTPEGDITVDISYSPYAKRLTDLNGRSVTGGFTGAFGLAGGLSVSRSASGESLGKAPETTTVSIGGGGGAAGYVFVTSTSTKSLYTSSKNKDVGNVNKANEVTSGTNAKSSGGPQAQLKNTIKKAVEKVTNVVKSVVNSIKSIFGGKKR